MASNPVRVAVVQTAAKLGASPENLDHAHERLAELRGRADIVVFPELHLGGYYFPDVNDIALAGDDPRLVDLGRHGPAVVVGFAERLAPKPDCSPRFHNAAALIDGDRVHIERKAFLPSAQERRWFSPGEPRKQVFQVRGAKIAIPICYDLWMAPVPWQAAVDGAEILIAPSASAADPLAAPDGVSVDEHWEVLNRHAAVAMQSFVVFVNRVGPETDPATGETKKFWGGSAVLGPDGEFRSRPLDDKPGTGVAELDLREVHDGRKKMPIFPDYRHRTMELLDTGRRLTPAPKSAATA